MTIPTELRASLSRWLPKLRDEELGAGPSARQRPAGQILGTAAAMGIEVEG